MPEMLQNAPETGNALFVCHHIYIVQLVIYVRCYVVSFYLGGQCASLSLDGVETTLELIVWPNNEVDYTVIVAYLYV